MPEHPTSDVVQVPKVCRHAACYCALCDILVKVNTLGELEP
jgi:hypothetical protein